MLLLYSCGGGSGDVTEEPNPLPIPQPTEPPTQEIPVSETKTITQTIDGQQVDRTYLIRYPSEVTKASYPVVFFFMVQEVMVKDGLAIVLRLKI